MKKIFAFALALVACVMTFTSCEKKIESPLVGSWSHKGTLRVVNPVDGTSVTYEALFSFDFIDNGDFQYNISIIPEGDVVAIHDEYITFGTWTVEGDIITLNKKTYGLRHDGQFTVDATFKPSEELVKWRIDGHNLIVKREYGTEKEYEESFSDGSR